MAENKRLDRFQLGDVEKTPSTVLKYNFIFINGQWKTKINTRMTL